MDEAGFDTIWLAEAYPWWRKHSMEARSSTALSPLVARETERLAVGWGIISPYTRHPIQIAMEARVTQEAAGRGPLLPRARRLEDLHAALGEGEPRGARRGRARRSRRRSRSSARRWPARRSTTRAGSSRRMRRRCPTRRTRRAAPSRCTSPAPGRGCSELAGEIGDGLLTAAHHDAGVRALRAREHGRGRRAQPAATPTRWTSAARSWQRSARTATRGREGAREIAGMYLANKVQNIRGSADTLLERPASRWTRSRRSPRRWSAAGGWRRRPGGQRRDPRQGQADRGHAGGLRAAIEEYRDAGCTHVMLELWGEDRDEQIRLFGERVLPAVRAVA